MFPRRLHRGPNKGQLVFLKDSVMMEDPQGGRSPVPKGALMELVGESRVVDGEVQVLVRRFVYSLSDDQDAQEAMRGAPGWIPETALPSTDEDSVWGVTGGSVP